jgi:GDP-L-fucose synthase
MGEAEKAIDENIAFPYLYSMVHQTKAKKFIGLTGESETLEEAVRKKHEIDERIMKPTDKIYVAGHRGMVGSAFVRLLMKRGYKNLIMATHSVLDLTDKQKVDDFFEKMRPDYVILAAAKVGGIKANMENNSKFLLENSTIQNNVLSACNKYGVKKTIMLGSSCIYPAQCKQPIKEEYMLTGPLEPTNEGYALAKISGIKLAQFYNREYGLKVLCPMPCNLYGTNDSFDPNNSHVLSGLTKKFSDAVKEKKTSVTLWGTGIARREFLNVDDAVRAILLAMDKWDSPEIINIGSGEDISIKELAQMVAEESGFNGEIEWDATMPDGMLLKKLDISKLRALGFKPEISLRAGVKQMLHEYSVSTRR